MLKTFFSLLFSLMAICAVHAQQLYLEGFVGRNRSNFDIPPFNNSAQWFAPVGGRVAFGADHVQFGAEYHQNLSNPQWNDADLPSTSTSFETSYYGALIRTKISRYPAMRFGLTLRAGAGFFNTTRVSTVPILTPSVDYKQKLGFNGGIGASIPILRPVMLELGYSYYFVEYDEVAGLMGAMNGSFHSVQAGLSFNFVFGKRAAEYRDLRRK